MTEDFSEKIYKYWARFFKEVHVGLAAAVAEADNLLGLRKEERPQNRPRHSRSAFSKKLKAYLKN